MQPLSGAVSDSGQPPLRIGELLGVVMLQRCRNFKSAQCHYAELVSIAFTGSGFSTGSSNEITSDPSQDPIDMLFGEKAGKRDIERPDLPGRTHPRPQGSCFGAFLPGQTHK
jgi:hypothetical protein